MDFKTIKGYCLILLITIVMIFSNSLNTYAAALPDAPKQVTKTPTKASDKPKITVPLAKPSISIPALLNQTTTKPAVTSSLIGTSTAPADTSQTSQLVNNGGGGSDGSWCNVTIKQGGVGHASGCTVCSLQLILQNSGQLKANQLNGAITSRTDEYNAFDSACSGAGFQSGDSWVLGSVASGFTSLCNSSWSSESTQGTTSDYNGFPALTGMNGRDFVSMSMSEQVTCMKTLYNSGYFAVFCVK